MSDRLAPGFRASSPEKKLIIADTAPGELFENEPGMMLGAIELAAKTGYDLSRPVYEAILEKGKIAAELEKTELRDFLKTILAGEYAGKAIKMLGGTGLLGAVVGGEVWAKMTRREWEDYYTLGGGIDSTGQVLLRRLGLFYTVFEEKPGLKAIAYLDFDKETAGTLSDAVKLLDNLAFLTNKYDLKKFICEHGNEKYEYLNNLSKARRIVYDHAEEKILARKYILEDIIRCKEAIFVEDLVVGPKEIREAGIAEGAEAEKLAFLLLDIVHIKPYLNTKTELYKYARKFKKSKLAASFRKLKWIK